ncbi:hypothetical protein IP81_16810 [Novosphingobium sp. AAP83]|uniref:hypothetical protein n=1 Tax=Novosphingobium sp. AAP83 TaxID=1523425 RepID=UPI0006B93BD7|nr:hypothetical protein [Novosphingobium sp. AAP83]KPF89319.1 hypothetical protein IP81_16810 [Novosphingobium sp. AAP83]
MSARNWIEAIPSEQAYAINRMMYDIQHDREEEKRFFADPAAYIGNAPLTDEAREALARTDIGKLYLLGANPYLMRAYCLQLRIPEQDYLDALRAVEDQAYG